jgi:hypothetical protein
MPSVKISALPPYTGSNYDLRWFIMNNSAETITYKYSGYSSPLKYGDTDNSVVSQNVSPDKVGGPNDIIISSASDNTINSTNGNNAIILGASNTFVGNSNNTSLISTSSSNVDSSATSSIVAGVSNSLNGISLFIGGGGSNAILASNTSAIVAGSSNTMWTTADSFIGGGNSHYIPPYTSVNRAGFLGGDNNEIGNGSSDSVILGGANHYIQNTSPKSAIAGGDTNLIEQTTNGFIGGGYLNIISGTSLVESAIIGGNTNTINSSDALISASYNSFIGTIGQYGSIISSQNAILDNSLSSSIIASDNSEITGYSQNNAIVGGNNHKIDSDGSFIGGGSENFIYGYVNDASPYAAIIAGTENEIFGDGNERGVILGGRLNKLTNYSSRSATLGGISNTIDSHTNAIITGGEANLISGSTGTNAGIYSSYQSQITSTSSNNTIIGSTDSQITGTTQNAVMVGTQSRVATRDNAAFVENLVIADWANLDFADDSAAAAGGVVLGQVYHDNGALRIRIS